MRIETNIDQVQSQLRRSAQEAIEKAKRELQMTALEVEREAKLNAPVDTGMLRASITNEEVDDGYEVFTNVEYAQFIEYGTSRQAARPFLTPALDVATKGLKQRLERIIAEQLD